MKISPLPNFYKSVFKVWTLVKKERKDQVESLHWLLQEPVLWGTRLVLPSWTGENMLTSLLRSQHWPKWWRAPTMTTPGDKLLGWDWSQNALQKKSLGGHDNLLLNSPQAATEEDAFPVILLAPFPKGCSGPLLDSNHPVSLDSTTAKTLYKIVVKAINQDKLHNRHDTEWRENLSLPPSGQPEWRSFYKPLLSKRHAALHWRVLHGAVAVNTFVSTINTAATDRASPFCGTRETVFHSFWRHHVLPLFLQTVF